MGRKTTKKEIIKIMAIVILFLFFLIIGFCEIEKRWKNEERNCITETLQCLGSIGKKRIK